MNKRKMIYKGFNKRRKTNYTPVFFGVFVICFGMVYGAKFLKLNFKEKVKEIKETFEVTTNKNKTNEFTYEDVKEDLQKSQEENKETEKSDVKEESMVASINEWTFYTVQVASMKEDIEVEKLTAELSNKKIPYSVMESDDIKKVQTYTSFNKELIRNDLEEVRKDYPDAFLSEVSMPMISLEYTNKYSFISEITNALNDLVKNFEEETLFWNENKENVDFTKYNQILTNRKSSVDKIKLESKKIDYEGMEVFKDNLVKYINEVENNINETSKSANEQNLSKSKSLLLDSMQGYFEFINSLG